MLCFFVVVFTQKIKVQNKLYVLNCICLISCLTSAVNICGQLSLTNFSWTGVLVLSPVKEYAGPGNRTFKPMNASRDALPTELTGPVIAFKYAVMFMLNQGINQHVKHADCLDTKVLEKV